MKKNILLIMSSIILISCGDDNSIEEENIICDNQNIQRIEFTSPISGDNPELRESYSYDLGGSLINKNIESFDNPYPQSTSFYYNESDQFKKEVYSWADRTDFGGYIKDYSYNITGQLFEFNYYNYRSNGEYIDEFTPDADTTLIRQFNYSYQDKLITRNSNLIDNIMVYQLNENGDIIAIHLSELNNNKINFNYDLNGNVISGIGLINGQESNIKISYKCEIKHPTFKLFSFTDIITSRSTTLRYYIEKIVELSDNYPSIIEWTDSEDNIFTITYVYDFDLEGYPKRIETIYSNNISISQNRKEIHYRWGN